MNGPGKASHWKKEESLPAKDFHPSIKTIFIFIIMWVCPITFGPPKMKDHV